MTNDPKFKVLAILPDGSIWAGYTSQKYTLDNLTWFLVQRYQQGGNLKKESNGWTNQRISAGYVLRCYCIKKAEIKIIKSIIPPNQILIPGRNLLVERIFGRNTIRNIYVTLKNLHGNKVKVTQISTF